MHKIILYKKLNKKEVKFYSIEFTFLLNSFINSIYPLLHPTHKQLIALKESVKWYNVPDFKFTLYDGILLLTANLKK